MPESWKQAASKDPLRATQTGYPTLQFRDATCTQLKSMDRSPKVKMPGCVKSLKVCGLVAWRESFRKPVNTPVAYRCLQSSCLLRLCFTHLPHCQALFHAPDKFQERTFSCSRLWALGSEKCLLGHQTILMVKPFKNNGSERKSRRTPRQPCTNTMPRALP